jgi:SAM-dependent methyltransferase
VESVYRDYKRYGDVSPFYGRIAEVGPGDNSGVALLFLADGCESVDLLDRFYFKPNMDRNAEIYRALTARHPALETLTAESNGTREPNFVGLHRHSGEIASAERFFTESGIYDAIVSRAVLEHIYDPKIALKKMANALKPGGMLLHKVDLRDHGMFSEFFHELKFLEIPDGFYRRMTRNAGGPNRILVNEYRAVLSGLFPDYKVLVTRLAGAGDIEPHLPYQEISPHLREKAVEYVRSVRKRFARSLRMVSDEDLSIAGIFIVARKPDRE